MAWALPAASPSTLPSQARDSLAGLAETQGQTVMREETAVSSWNAQSSFTHQWKSFSGVYSRVALVGPPLNGFSVCKCAPLLLRLGGNASSQVVLEPHHLT